MEDNNLGVEDLNSFLNEATAQGVLRPGEAEAMKITFLALARIGGKAAVLIIKTVVKILKKAGVVIKGLKK